MVMLLGAARERALSRVCRGCGCTDQHACPGGCAWALLDVDEDTGVCTACAERLRWHMGLLATVGWDPEGFAATLEQLEGDALRELHGSAVGDRLLRGAA